jgi:tetratricopeptide (TPR) repeat protein
MLSIRNAVLTLALAVSSAAFAGDEVLSSALDAYKAGDYAKVVELTSAVNADDPARLKAAYLLGEASLMLDKADDAEKAFQEILDKKADNVPALVGRGRAELAKSHVDDALKTLEQAVKLDAKDAAARRCLGEARFAKGDEAKAREDLQAATKLDPKDALASRALVEVLLKDEKTDMAEKEAERIAKAAPDQAMAWFLVGYVMDKKGKDKDAIEAYEKAIAKDEKFLDAHKNLAILCVAKNPSYKDRERTKKALDHFQKYFDLGGKDEQLKQDYEQIKAYMSGKK